MAMVASGFVTASTRRSRVIRDHQLPVAAIAATTAAVAVSIVRHGTVRP